MLSRAEFAELLEEHLEPISRDLRSLSRAVRGEPLEGNQGLITRLQVAEKRLSILIWTIPIWVTIGTGLGQVLISWWNL